MNPSLLPEMVSIPAGQIALGVPACPPRANFAWIWHTGKSVPVAAFQMAKFAVTNVEYRNFLSATGHPAPSNLELPGFNDARHPVVGVSWDDASAYCRWLAQQTGRPFRLPTDAEWEYAARGGRAGTIFPWGNDLDPKHACFGGQPGPRPVGYYPPNGFGLHEMIGNAWEWCQDRFEDVSHGVKAVNRPTQKDPALNRVVRGGSFQTCHYLNLWIAYRHEDPPDLRHESIGFRVAL